MKANLSLQNLRCPRCGNKMRISKFQSNVRKGRIVGYCLNENHVYNPLKVVVVQKIRLQINNKRKFDIDKSHNMKKIKCVICGNKLYFNKHASFQTGNKVVGDCLKEGHRIELTLVAKVVNEPDCKEIMQVKIQDSKFGYNYRS